MGSVIAGLVDFCFAFIVLIGMMFYYGIRPSTSIFLFPVFLLLAVATALAAGLWLSALNVQFRDVKHTIPFLTQFWLFATPVVYPSSLVPAKWRVWYGLNPMAGVVDGFRYAVLGKGQPGPDDLGVSRCRGRAADGRPAVLQEDGVDVCGHRIAVVCGSLV